MEEIVKHINDTNASYRSPNAGDAKNTDLFLDNEHYELFKDSGEQITVRFSKENLSKAILFIASILPRKYDNSAMHKSVSYSPEFVFDQLAFLDYYFKENGVSVAHKTQTWNARKDVPKKNGEIDNRFYFNGLLEEVAYVNSKGENVSSKFTIRNYLAGNYSNLHIKKAEDGIFDVWVTNVQEPYSDNKEEGLEVLDKHIPNNLSLQQIYYGAPGTGKSHTINEQTQGESVIRATFHPDSDYSTFVGAYKPTMKEVTMRDLSGHPVLENGVALTEDKIIYEFVDQAFLQAYVQSWKNRQIGSLTIDSGNYSLCGINDDSLYWRNLKTENNEENTAKKETIQKHFDGQVPADIKSSAQSVIAAYLKRIDSNFERAWKKLTRRLSSITPQYLIIEEINRGNCAQIFGDLFQLLDRNDYGFSVYPINADKDMKKQLQKAFKGITINDADYINSIFKGRNVVKEILNGDILLLPNNLYIWATMNTSDQSLFPIDSAFKRRWEWQYMPIGKSYDENGQEIKWAIEGATKKYSWWSFLEKINAQIAEATQSEDKKLGFFFCKATDGIISAEKFVGKVIFYLWNDVFKNNGFEGPIFKDVDGTELSFGKFYKSDLKGNAIVQKDKVELFLNNLGVEEFKDENNTPEQEEDEDGNVTSSPSTGRDYTKFSVNGNGRYAKNNLAAECVKKYIELNPTKSAEEILSDWLSLGNIVPHFVESKEQYEARTDNSKRSHEIPCAGTVIYVAHNGYGSNGKVLVLKEAVNQKNWGITIDQA